MSSLRTHYDNLQVKETASLDVIKGAYKHLSQKWHPDKHPHDRERAERTLKIINRAYEVLSDPEQRRLHDEWIASLQASPSGGATLAGANALAIPLKDSDEPDTKGARQNFLKDARDLMLGGPFVALVASHYAYNNKSGAIAAAIVDAIASSVVVYGAAAIAAGIGWILRKQHPRPLTTFVIASWVICAFAIYGWWQ